MTETVMTENEEIEQREELAIEKEADVAVDPAVAALNLLNEELTLKNTELSKSLADATAALNTYQEAERVATAQAQETKVLALVNLAVEQGKVSEELKDKWVNLATADYDTAEATLAGLASLTAKQAVSAMSEVSNLALTDDAIPELRKMEKDNPRKVQEILNTDRNLYKAMFKKQYGTEYLG